MTLALRGLLIGIVVVACAESTVVDKSDGVEWQRIGNYTYLAEVVTPSGIRCVVYDGEAAGGISCDWGER